MQSTSTSELWRLQPRVMKERELLGAWQLALRGRGKPGTPKEFRVYVSFPYCTSRCRYCMYYSNRLQRAAGLERYILRLGRQLDRFRDACGRVDTDCAYFGGGTPSLWPEELLAAFLESFGRTFCVRGQFTAEANPASFDEGKARRLLEDGVNRVSMGIQSLDPKVLKAVARRSVRASHIGSLVEYLHRGDAQVNLDLLMGLPNQTRRSVLRDLRQCMEFNPDTITLYRFMETPGLAAARSAELRFRSVVDLDTIRLAASRRFFLFPTRRNDNDNSVVFVRLNSRMVALMGQIALGMLPALLGKPTWFPGYFCFERAYSHILGLGTGAFQHIFGHAWSRDVTGLDAEADCDGAIHLGTRLTADEELRYEIADRLQNGAWVSLSELRKRYGPEATKPVSRELEAGRDAGLLVSRLGTIRLREKAPAQQAWLQSLLPYHPAPLTGNELARSLPADLLARIDATLLPFHEA